MNIIYSLIIIFVFMGIPTGISLWYSEKKLKEEGKPNTYWPALVGIIVMAITGIITWYISPAVVIFLENL
jgi:hypothetical protein